MSTKVPVIRLTKHPYDELVEIVTEGVAYRWMRAHKYIDDPSPDLIRKAIADAVLCALDNHATFAWKRVRD